MGAASPRIVCQLAHGTCSPRAQGTERPRWPMRRLDVRTLAIALSTLALFVVGCSGPGGDAVGSADQELSGCHGHASSVQPASGDYGLTSFGGGRDTQTMACGGLADGSWYYA